MTRQRSIFISAFLLSCAFFPAPSFAMKDRAEVEARVRADVTEDLVSLWQPESLTGRFCLDGRPVADFPGDVVEFWINLECPYCGILEPIQAQRRNFDICIVPRHIPSLEYGESMKKALGYEALKSFSVNAANMFWNRVIPKKTDPLPLPYEGSLLLAFQEAAIDPDAFGEALSFEASEIISQDIMDAQGRFYVVPTWVLDGIRFPACEFTAAQIPIALELAKKARAGDENALERVITLITNALMREPMM